MSHTCTSRRCHTVIGPFYLVTLGRGGRGLVQVVLCLDCALGVRRPDGVPFEAMAAPLVDVSEELAATQKPNGGRR